MGSQRRGLRVVSNDKDGDTNEPTTFTFEDSLMDNGRMVRALIDTHGLEDQAAVSLFAITLQGHLQQAQTRALQEGS